MGSKISVQQRKYFVERIESSINEKINSLKQANAAQVQNISEKAYDKYLNLLKVDKDMQKFDKLDVEHKQLQSKLVSVYIFPEACTIAPVSSSTTGVLART